MEGGAFQRNAGRYIATLLDSRSEVRPPTPEPLGEHPVSGPWATDLRNIPRGLYPTPHNRGIGWLAHGAIDASYRYCPGVID